MKRYMYSDTPIVDIRSATEYWIREVVGGAAPPATTFTVLGSIGTSYTVSRNVLSSVGVSYTVGGTVLASNGTAYNPI